MSAGIRNRIFFGLLLLALGGVFLAENLTAFEFDWGEWWPAILIILGVVSLPSSRWTGVVLTLVGAVFLVDNLDLLAVNIGDFWPVALIAVGVWVLFGGRERRTRGGPAADAQADDLEASASFGSVERRVTSKSFRGGKVSVMFGSADVDLRDARLAGESAVLHLDVLFGSAEIRVPDGWAVEVRASATLGGVEVNRRAPAEPSATLVLTGSCTFGGITVV